MTELCRNARVAGILYISASVVGFFRLMYIPEHLFVSGDATTTASNIAAHESLFRWGIASQPLAYALWLCVPLALYRLLKNVDKDLAALMVILGALMQTPIGVLNTVTDVAALQLVRGADYLAVFDKPQRDALARMFLNLHHQVDLAYMVFAGLWLLPFGLLVYRSRFLPRFLGAWLMLECFAWLAFSFTGFLLPGQEGKVFTYSQPLMFAEVAIMLWLVIMGATEKRLAVAEG